MLNFSGTSTSRPSETPRLPVLVGKAEHGLAREHALDVDPHGLLQIVVDQAQHLERLVHLDRPLRQPVVVAQSGHATDVDAGNGGAAEIDRNAVRLAVFQGREHSLSARHSVIVASTDASESVFQITIYPLRAARLASDQLEQLSLIDNRDTNFSSLIELRAGILARHDIAGFLADRPRDLAARGFDHLLGLVRA